MSHVTCTWQSHDPPQCMGLSLPTFRGNLTILNAGTEGFAPLVVIEGGHSATIRCAHWDHEVGVALWGVLGYAECKRCTN